VCRGIGRITPEEEAAYAREAKKTARRAWLMALWAKVREPLDAALAAVLGPGILFVLSTSQAAAQRGLVLWIRILAGVLFLSGAWDIFSWARRHRSKEGSC
jgi:hypothetical protein